MKKYSVILADPPWHFHNYDDEPGEFKKEKLRSRKAQSFYPTMSIDELCILNIPTDKNAALFLWACWPLLPEAMRLIDAWKFKYKTVAWNWVKSTPSGFSFHFGMGYYTRANTEPCLLAVRGSMPVAVHDVQALIYSPVQEHSKKPDEQYDKIARLYPTGDRLEMFARHKHEGWDVWGNEVDSDIVI